MNEQKKIVGEVFDVIEMEDETIIYVRLPPGFKVDYFQKVEVTVVADLKVPK